MHIHDLIGVGFGPSNIALAIALEEQHREGAAPDMLFIDRQSEFAWHPDMLLPGTHMQISFLKDLATLRNPRSRFTFVNYLHDRRRLQDFINLKTFFPSRQEFNDYLTWAAEQFADRCAFGEDVVEVLPERLGNDVTLLRVRSRTAGGAMRERLARNLVLGVGGAPSIPECFAEFRDDPRVFHSSNYLQAIARVPNARRIAVVGAGQSATEIFVDQHSRHDDTRVDLIMRARSIKPSDDSPFVNEIFNADFTDFVYSRPNDERAALLNEFWNTNYAAPDAALLEKIFDIFYQQRVSGDERHRFRRRHEIQSARAAADGIHLSILDMNTQREINVRYDAIVLATGYARDRHKTLLAPLAPWLGDFEVDRHYRLQAAAALKPAIFLQGACEDSHGLADTLLSVTAVRTGEIGQALMGSTPSPSPSLFSPGGPPSVASAHRVAESDA